MTTISVPLPAHLEEFVNKLAEERGSNKAAVVRSAINLLAEEEAVQAVLRAQKEVSEGKILRGEAREILMD